MERCVTHDTAPSDVEAPHLELRLDENDGIASGRQESPRGRRKLLFPELGEQPAEPGAAAQIFTAPHQRRTQEYITGRFG